MTWHDPAEEPRPRPRPRAVEADRRSIGSIGTEAEPRKKGHVHMALATSHRALELTTPL